MAGNLTISALLTLGVDQLRGAPQPRDAGTQNLDAELLLAHALSKTRTHLKAHPEHSPTAEQARNYAELLNRRAAGEPIAYILGYRDFWTLTLAVNPSVLVPRPETELLVERALALGPNGPARIADLGTGSGAIALALASERPEWAVTATDVSEDALRTAQSNAVTLNLGRVEFLAGRWFAPLAGRRFDLIASNPPYVSDGDTALQDATLQHEPQIALASGPDGLSSLREIVHSAPNYLERRGWLILEHGSDQAAAVARELVGRGFGHVRSHPDLAGHWRITEGQWTASLLARHWPRGARVLFRRPGRPPKKRDFWRLPRGAGCIFCRPTRNTLEMIKFETSHGNFTIELFTKEAPLSAENFQKYVDDKYFDGTIFHRIIPNFMIQGGGMTTDFASKETRSPIKNEAKNGLKNTRGTLSMARTSDINSATSQFFVNLVDNAFLDNGPRDYGYAVFGRVTEGMDTVEKIAAVKTGRRKGYQDAPMEDVVIISARTVEK